MADIADRKGERVDYALQIDDTPVILIEAKVVGTPLDKVPAQLARYFNVVQSARFGVYTDGIRYLFFSDLVQSNIMDTQPFLVLDLREAIDPSIAIEIQKFTKSDFDAARILLSASRLKYVNALHIELKREFESPSVSLTKLLMGYVLEGRQTATKVEEFQIYTREAISQLVKSLVRERLTSALQTQNNVPEPEREPEEGDGIVTTQQEMDAWIIIRSMLRGIVGAERITMRDRKTVCLILLDDNGRKPIIRLWLDGNRYKIGIPQSNGSDDVHTIDSISALGDHRDAIREVTQSYLQ